MHPLPLLQGDDARGQYGHANNAMGLSKTRLGYDNNPGLPAGLGIGTWPKRAREKGPRELAPDLQRQLIRAAQDMGEVRGPPGVCWPRIRALNRGGASK